MFRPKNKKKEKAPKLNKESYQKAKKIFKYIKPYSLSFAIGWIFLVLSSSAGLFFPYLLGQLLGGSDVSNDATPIMNSNTNWVEQINLSNINTVALMLLILFVLQSIFSYFRIVIFTKVTENTLRDIRQEAFYKLIHMPLDFFNRNKVGELTSRLSADISLIQDTLRTTIAEFFRQIIIVLGSIIFITIVSWRLALIMIASVPIMAIIAVFFGRFIRKLSKAAQNSAAESNSIIEENLMGITNVKTYTNEQNVYNRYKKTVDEIRSLNIKSGNWRGVFVSFIFIGLFGAVIFIIWQGLHMTMGPNPSLAKGDFFSFVMFTVFMGASVGSLPDLYASIQKAVGATENLMELINEKTENEIHKGIEKPNIKGNIKFHDVDFTYPQRPDIKILTALNLNVQSGEKIALVGASGAGKTTIGALIQSFYLPSSGSILFDDISADEIDLEHLRSAIALVPQEVILFGGSIKENIAFGKEDATQEEIIDAAKKANAWSFIEKFPDQLETQVGDRGIQLSGGQKQRIAIARAILKNPKILILDEATSALDAESEKLVQDALDVLMEGRTSIIIAHRLSTIKKADKILVINEGKIIESGTHNELIQKENGAYAKLSNLQLDN